jgi:methyltransferase
MAGTIWAYVIIGLVAAQRLAEIFYAQRNTRALLARGAFEVGRAHYPLIVALHVAWLGAILYFLPTPTTINSIALGLVVVLQILRLWVVVTLGPYWTTRIITLPGAPFIRNGPYRFMRHPNYAVVIAEIAALPLVFGEVAVAIVFSALNAIILAWRIRQEDAALAARRTASQA